jgi:hypothetical protein
MPPIVWCTNASQSSGGIRLVAKVKFKLSVEKITFEYDGDHDTGLAVNRAMNHTLGALVEAQNQVIDVTPNKVEGVSMPAVTALTGPSTRRRYRRRLKPTANEASLDTVETNGKSASVKPLRARRARGDSLRGLVHVLLREGYFTKSRTATELRDELSRRGHNFDPKNVASDLLRRAVSRCGGRTVKGRKELRSRHGRGWIGR